MRRMDREVFDIEEMKSILNNADTCHVAMVDDGEPYIVALNYGFIWTDKNPILYFHCAKEGRKLDVLRKKPEVCFTIDCDHELVRGNEACQWGMKYRSIVGTGSVGFIQTSEEKKRGLDLLMAHYGASDAGEYAEAVFNRTEILKLTVKTLSCKKKL